MQSPTGYTVSFMVVPNVWAWGFSLNICPKRCAAFSLHYKLECFFISLNCVLNRKYFFNIFS